jgi:hypothetical protein
MSATAIGTHKLLPLAVEKQQQLSQNEKLTLPLLGFDPATFVTACHLFIFFCVCSHLIVFYVCVLVSFS